MYNKNYRENACGSRVEISMKLLGVAIAYISC